jgi:Tol biopolymer transport system component
MGDDMRRIDSTAAVRSTISRGIALLVNTGMTMVGLGTFAGPAAHATAPGENGRIAFVRYFNEEHTRGAIFTIDPDGTRLIQVTHRGRDLLDSEPDWSPDGRWIVFERSAPGEPLRLFKVRANGTHLTRLSHNPCLPDTCPNDLEGVWSPDGRWIAFSRFDDRDPDPDALFKMQADGSHVSLVTARGTEPGWSPDGERLSYVRRTQSGGIAIFTARLDGTHERQVSPWRLHAGDHPDWSPDGRWIVFHSNDDRDRQRNVYLAHPSGTGLHRITDTFTHGALTYLSYSFSPDGTLITVAFTGVGEPGNPDVWVMNLDGTGFRNVTSSVIWDSRPDWGPRP